LLWRDPERLSRPLTKGSKGPAVEKLQTLLAEAGFLKEKPNGDYDDATEQAVRRLQSKSGLNESGDATTLTQIILYNAIERYQRPELRPPAAENEDRVARSVS
jgi:peptidoglycan hydrolase-like protein with peptidoglycan-binding domain